MTDADGCRVPLRDIPQDAVDLLVARGGRPLNIHRVLANQPRMLGAWIDFLYTLRLECTSPRTTREIMILRCAVVCDSDYEWAQHHKLSVGAGVSVEQVAAVRDWQNADVFSPAERAALALVDEMMVGRVGDEVFAELGNHFTPGEQVELSLTAGAYAMAARFMDALQVPVES